MIALLVWCADLFCTYRPTRASVALARVPLARMSSALAVLGDVAKNGSQQDHARALLHTPLHAPALGQCALLASDVRIQFDLVGNSHPSNLLPSWITPAYINSLNLGALH